MASGAPHPFLDSGREVVVVDAVRTPFGRSDPERGLYRDTHPNVLLGSCYEALLDRTGVPPAEVEDVLIGCTAPYGEQMRNIARNAWLQVGYPPEVPAVTMDRRCGSAHSAISMAAGLIASGTHDVVVAGGVEHMQRVPTDALPRIEEAFGTPWPPELWERYDFINQGLSGELIAERWEIERQEMDELGLRSQQRAAAATADGSFAREMAPVPTPHGVPENDQGIRSETTLEKLGTLRTPFKPDGRLTAGTSSQISDGAGAVLLTSRPYAQAHGLKARARIFDQTTVGVDPIIMLTGPIPATKKLLARNALTASDIDRFEVNEAFASVVLAWQREIAPDPDRVNVRGGAIALGHPVGASGARLFATMVNQLEQADLELGLITMCCGGGLGTGTILQRVES
jgi:acetyl-CoA acetyltransferase family protein